MHIAAVVFIIMGVVFGICLLARIFGKKHGKKTNK